MITPCYNTINNLTNSGVQYLFISKGKKDIIKAIAYNIVDVETDVIKTDKIFNLGFGDYDYTKGTIDDSVSSDNGDVYKVFHTVLNTIPDFFKVYPNEAIMVSGSDSKADFIENCILICKKKCTDATLCKNQHRRINVYKNHVDRNFNELNKTYTFYGGLEGVIELYQPQKKYDSVFVIKSK